MVQLILCLTLLNTGFISQNTLIYNTQLDHIQEIMNTDGYGDLFQGDIQMPCRIKSGQLNSTASECNLANLNTILRHYNLRKEIAIINKENK